MHMYFIIIYFTCITLSYIDLADFLYALYVVQFGCIPGFVLSVRQVETANA